MMRNKTEDEVEENIMKLPKAIFLTVLGIAGIVFGSNFVVDSATYIATALGVSERMIGLTIIAMGTSLPELVTSVIASKKGEVDIAIGNVVGSNIFNIFFILGLSSTISPITFRFDSFIDIIVMLGASILTYILLLKNKRIGNKKGIILLLAYVIYMVYILIR